jgi:hypothetical protein
VCILYCGCFNLFCNVWVCVGVGFVMCGCVYVLVLFCVYVRVVCFVCWFLCGFCVVWVCVCVGFVMFGFVYVWVL